MNADGSNRRALTASLDRSVGGPVWAGDGRSIFVQYDDHGETRVARVGLDGAIRTVAEGLSGADFDRPYTGGSFSVARDGAVALAGGSATRPPDVVLVRGGARRQLTRLNADLLDNKSLGEVRHIAVASSVDQRPIDAWITLPPAYTQGQRVPLILEIHGGPFAAYGPHFSTDDQLYAAAGYAVLSVNPRGSTSYGADFANLIHHAYPGQDYDDLMSAVDAAIAQGFADPDHLFVTGGSGGGVLTAWIVGKTNRFRAAATQKPVIDWSSFVLTADGPPLLLALLVRPLSVGGPAGLLGALASVAGRQRPDADFGRGRQRGLSHARTARPSNIIRRCSCRGVPTALVKVPGAGHGNIAGAALAERRQGGRDPGLVRALSGAGRRGSAAQ